MKPTKKKLSNKMYMLVFLLVIFSSGTHAVELIDSSANELENQPKEILNNYIPIINSYDVVEKIAPYYENIGVQFDDYTVVLKFNQTDLMFIQEYDTQTLDFKIQFDKEDVIYLLDNYESMNSRDKIKFILNLNMPVKDILTLGSVLIGEI